MTLGPLEYTVIGFQGNRFSGRIAEEIARVVESGVIALVDVVFITKNVGGEVVFAEIDNKDDPRFAGFTPMLRGLSGLLTQDDVMTVAETLPADTSALVLLFEHRWATHVKDAIAAAGGFLVSRETISPEVLEDLNAELDAAALSA
jgi:hypothetical protein